MRKGLFEPETVNFFLKEFETASLFVDIGAHHGYFTCLANYSGVQKVISIEPDKLNFKFLRKNVIQNKFVYNSKLINMAVGETKGELKIFGFGTGVSFRKTWGGNVSKRSSTVSMDSLDSILGLEIPLENAVVKIDVEGFELPVIKGAINVIDSAKNSIFFVEISLLIDQNESITKQAAPGVSQLILIFLSAGYHLFRISEIGSNLILLSNHEIDLLSSNLQNYSGCNYVFKKIIQ
jgi:FkbM family methyltransferase